MFLRPRRFGKTLFLSSLEYFHNIQYKDQYQDIFKHLQIGKEENVIHNSYLVLFFDFSSLDIKGIEGFKLSMKNHINNKIIDFKKVYSNIYKIEEIIINPEDAISSFQSLWMFIKNNNQKLYVLIDEYDTQVN